MSLFNLMNGYDFISKYEDIEPNWIVEGAFETGTINFICSDGGKGKTWFLMSLFKALSSGKKWLDHFNVPKMKCLYIDRDMSPSLVSRRLLKLGQKEDFIYSTVDRPKLDLSNSDHVEDLLGLILEKKYEVIMIDAFYKITGHYKENDNDDMAVVMSIFDRIREIQFQVNGKEVNPTIFIIHHSSKNTFNNSNEIVVRGASSIKNGCDNVFTIEKYENAPFVFRSLKLRESDGTEFRIKYTMNLKDENMSIEYYNPDKAKAEVQNQLKNHILSILQDGMNQSTIISKLRENNVVFDDKSLRSTLDSMNEIEVHKGPKNSNVYYTKEL
jgi:RecA-family ATPase